MRFTLFFAALFGSLTLQAQNTIGVTDFQPDLVDDGYLDLPAQPTHVYCWTSAAKRSTWDNADTLRPGNVTCARKMATSS